MNFGRGALSSSAGQVLGNVANGNAPLDRFSVGATLGAGLGSVYRAYASSTLVGSSSGIAKSVLDGFYTGRTEFLGGALENTFNTGANDGQPLSPAVDFGADTSNGFKTLSREGNKSQTIMMEPLNINY